jgi:hypothetical protein
MLLNSFNSKINLPSVVSKLGINTSEYDFIRVPLFGWYAKAKNSDFVGNIFDFFPIQDWKKVYGIICRDFSDCFDFALPYSEYAEKTLYKDQTKIMQFQSAWILSIQEAQSARVRYHDKILYFKDLLNEMGMPALIDNRFGYLSEKVIKTFPNLDLENKFKYKKNVVIPTFCSPKHICSLEISRLSEINERELMFLNGEFGWYGIQGIEVVRDLNELKIKPGNTWNYKNDYWNKQPIALSDMLSTEQLIKIWSQTKQSIYSVDIKDLMIGKQGHNSLKNYVAMLDYNQVIELEKNSQQPLIDYWMKSREQQFTVQGRTYIKRDKAYYLLKKTEEEQLTNFTLDVNEIKKKTDDLFLWCGIIYFEEHAVPFELEDKYFTSCFLFTKGIRKMFLNLGIGIPFINEKYVRQLMTMIQLTAHNVKINNSQ